MLREALQIDGRRGDDHLEIRALGQNGLEIAEQEINVQAALVRLVNDQRVVTIEEAVVLRLGQQDAVGHQLDQRVLAALIGKAHLIANGFPKRRAKLFRNPCGHAPSCEPPWLRVADQPVSASAKFETNLRKLRGFAGAGFASDHYHLVVADRCGNIVALGGDWQVLVITYSRHALAALFDTRAGSLEAFEPFALRAGIVFFAKVVELPGQAMSVGSHRAAEVGGGAVRIGHVRIVRWRGWAVERHEVGCIVAKRAWAGRALRMLLRGHAHSHGEPALQAGVLWERTWARMSPCKLLRGHARSYGEPALQAGMLWERTWARRGSCMLLRGHARCYGQSALQAGVL